MILTHNIYNLAEVNLPVETFSIQGPFITFNILHTSLYSRSGNNFGVSKKHLHQIHGTSLLSIPNILSKQVNIYASCPEIHRPVSSNIDIISKTTIAYKFLDGCYQVLIKIMVI